MQQCHRTSNERAKGEERERENEENSENKRQAEGKRKRERFVFYYLHLRLPLHLSSLLFFCYFNTFFSLITARDYTHSAFTLVVTSSLFCSLSRCLFFSCEQYYWLNLKASSLVSQILWEKWTKVKVLRVGSRHGKRRDEVIPRIQCHEEQSHHHSQHSTQAI